MSSSSAETVANIEELLKQILVRVPALSLIRFKCVSKYWLSLISDPHFRRRHTLQNPNPKISALFDESFKSVPLDVPPGWNPFKTLIDSVPDGTKLRILQSCNGLFLCHIPVSDDEEESKHHPIYVVNPTTNEFLPLSPPNFVGPGTNFVRYALACDPSKSPHYKVLCVTNYSYYSFWNHWNHRCRDDEGHYRVEMYSSETAEWERVDTPFFLSDDSDRPTHFDERSREAAVYCNGAVHWNRDRMGVGLSWGRTQTGDDPWSKDEWKADACDVVHYFDIGEQRLQLAPVAPPVALSLQTISLEDSLTGGIGWPSLAQRYFGECRGSLYLIDIFQHCMTQLEVLEMERDYSGWLVKYRVDLKPLVAAFPGEDWKAFVILGLSQEDETDNGVEETSTDLLLHLPGKIISYNLRNETFKMSVKLADGKLLLASGDIHGMQEHVTFPYVETLACL